MTEQNQTTEKRAEELAESWVNGNLTFVYKEILDTDDGGELGRCVECELYDNYNIWQARNFSRGMLRAAFNRIEVMGLV